MDLWLQVRSVLHEMVRGWLESIHARLRERK
jgi:hypothetical protein